MSAEEQELEKRYEKYKRILAGLTVMSDIFMRNVLKKRECTEYILQVIMDREDLDLCDFYYKKRCTWLWTSYLPH